jgi:hypothetical protein
MTNDDSKALVAIETGWAMPPTVVKKRMAEIGQYKGIMVEGEDYGTIPGTPKPTLYQPGADTLCIAAGLVVGSPVFLERKEDWEAGFFYYLVSQPLFRENGDLAGVGVGSCSSKEDKYAWRWVPTWLLSDDDKARAKTEGWKQDWRFSKKQGKKFLFYRMPNPDPYSQANTVLKMAVKRAYVSATLRATGAHRVFTQDIEDMPKEQRHVAAEVVDAEFDVIPPEGNDDSSRPPAPKAARTTTGTVPPGATTCPNHPDRVPSRAWSGYTGTGTAHFKIEGRKCTGKMPDGSWCSMLLGNDGYWYEGVDKDNYRRLEAEPTLPPAEDPEYIPPEEEGMLE